MKIMALYSTHGVILAAVQIDDDRHDGPVPVPSIGTEVGTFDVPDSANKNHLDEICKLFRVDVGSKRLVSAKSESV